MDEYYRVVRALGPPFGELLGTLPPARAAEIQEIRLRAGQPLQFTVAGRLVPCAQLLPVLRASGPLRQEDIRQTFLALCGHSVYAYEQELQDGYFTMPGGHRVGVAGLRGPGGFAAVTALCLRVARFITCPLPQALRQALDRLDGGILVIGPPGSGKTTLLRSILYYLAAQARIVCVADERGELLGEEGAQPDKPSVNCDVFTRCPRAAASEGIVSRGMMACGMGESSVDALLHETMSRMENPTLATYAKPCEVRLRATAKAPTREAAEAMLDPVEAQVRAALGDVVYGVNVGGLPEVCLALLKERHLTFATAESCTGGRVAERITALPGASAVYRGGVVSYWTEIKAAVLGVPQEILDQYGAVSEQTARAMAQGARRITGADLAVSVTGVAGPDPDERGTPVGIVYIGLDIPTGTFCRKMDSGRRRRDRIRGLAANHAFDVLRRYLTGLPVEALL